jgi:hypothetical protein
LLLQLLLLMLTTTAVAATKTVAINTAAAAAAVHNDQYCVLLYNHSGHRESSVHKELTTSSKSISCAFYVEYCCII